MNIHAKKVILGVSILVFGYIPKAGAVETTDITGIGISFPHTVYSAYLDSARTPGAVGLSGTDITRVGEIVSNLKKARLSSEMINDSRIRKQKLTHEFDRLITELEKLQTALEKLGNARNQ